MIGHAQCPNKRWDVSNDGSAYVDDLGNKAIYGNFTNIPESQYVNDGRLYFFGNITNNGYLGDGYGYEYIKSCGDSRTEIRGAGTTEFNILDVNNTAGVNLRQEMIVKTNLQFSGGIIHTDRTRTKDQVAFAPGASHSGANDQKHINGTIRRMGEGSFIFPTGDGDHQSPIQVRGRNPFDVFTATYISKNLDFVQQTSKGVYSTEQKDYNVLDVQEKEFWALDGGTSTRITLYWTQYSEILDLVQDVNDLIVVGWDGEKWVNLGQTEVLSFFGTGTVTSRSVIPDNYLAFTFGVLDSDGDFYADSQDIAPFDPCLPDPSSESCETQICVSVEAGVFLEGALWRDGEYMDDMSSRLNDFGYLPGQKPKTLFGVAFDPGQPYNVSPWQYDGTEGQEIDEINNIINSNTYPDDAVDWVLVSVRTDITYESTACTQAGLVLRDGTIVFTEPFDCCNMTEEDYYIVIEHRNHLAVMTPTPVMPDSTGLLSFDFRSNQSYKSLLGYQQKEIKEGMYAMFAGNGEQFMSLESPRDINSNDNGLWARDNGKHSGYYFQDYDLSGDVNVHDKAMWIINNGVFTDVQTSFN